MKIAQKIIGIVLCAMLFLVGIFLTVIMISSIAGMADNVSAISKYGSQAAESYARIMIVQIMRICVSLVLAILCFVTAGTNIGKAIRGRPASVLNRISLFIAFDVVTVAALYGYMFANIDASDKSWVAGFIFYGLFILAFVIVTSVLSTIARRNILNENGSKLKAGILLAVCYGLMSIALIMFAAANREITSVRNAYVFSEAEHDSIVAMNTVLCIFAWFGTCGTAAFAALCFVEHGKSRRNNNEQKVELFKGNEVEEKPEEKAE